MLPEKGTLDTPVLDSGHISERLENGIRPFLGIPYAAPPVGELGCMEPQPVEPGEEVRHAWTTGPPVPNPGPTGPGSWTWGWPITPPIPRDR